MTVGTIMTKATSLAVRDVPLVGRIADPVDMGEALAVGLPLVGQNEDLVEVGMLASYPAVQPSFVAAMAGWSGR